MLKTIPTHQVTLGMHIHELKGAWVDHPFWKTKFVLNDPADLKMLQTSIIKEVVIDVSKGVDVAEQTHVDEPRPLVIEVTKQILDSQLPTPTPKTQVRVSAQEEHAEASRIIKESKKAVVSMFKDVRLGKAVNAEAVMPLVDEIAASITRNEGALISLVRLKHQDDYTYMHSVAVCALMTALSKELNLSETETRQLGLAGLMHDLGKAQVPLAVLNKPGALTEEEFALVKKHPEFGHALLLQANINDPVTLDVCLHHHEKIDGTGYPKRLKDEEISLYAKMGAVCDVYDAITSNRPYKAGWEPGVSLKRMAQWSNHFDQTVFRAFVKSVGIYPIGSVVMLKSGRLAVVVDQTPKTLLQPMVKVFFSTKSKTHIPVTLIDLSKPNAQDEIIGHESAATWGVHNVHELWSEPSV
jgi:HD-GYP domain-containing protein (c-di-GMP phosphodiesterase class II)